MFKRTAPAFVAGVFFAVVVGGASAVAATGGSFLLGKSNTASSTTTLTAKSGPALALNAKGAPLKVGSSAKVANLNADKLDGLSASDFASAGGRSYTYQGTGLLIDSDDNGHNDTVVAAADCPAGTQLTGGGAFDGTAGGYLLGSVPDSDGAESWYAMVAFSETDPAPSGDDVVATATCWSPTGKRIGAGLRATKASDIPATLRAAARAKAAAQH